MYIILCANATSDTMCDRMGHCAMMSLSQWPRFWKSRKLSLFAQKCNSQMGLVGYAQTYLMLLHTVKQLTLNYHCVYTVIHSSWKHREAIASHTAWAVVLTEFDFQATGGATGTLVAPLIAFAHKLACIWFRLECFSFFREYRSGSGRVACMGMTTKGW